MNRRKFIEAAAVSASAFIIQYGNIKPVLPDSFLFKDDGVIPNSKYPLLLYHEAFAARGEKAAEWLETTFAGNNWSNSWRWGVYPFHHYHSNTHEVLGVFSGSALLHLGGEKGEKVKVQAGDIIVIPAGVGHKCIDHTDDFTVVGAYPNGMNPDLKRGEKSERPEADQNISAVPVPDTDPLLGKSGGLIKSWK
jgi:uncharacterized protein YjlB